MFLESAAPEVVLPALSALAAGPDQPLALFVARDSRAAVPALIDALRADRRTFFGGVFHGVIHGGTARDSGLHVLSLPLAAPPVLVPGLDLSGVDLPPAQPDATDTPREGCTLVVLVDGHSGAIGPFLRELFHRHGNTATYVGGGAGLLDPEPAPCVFTADGFLAGAAVVACVPQRCSVGVRHGWEPILGPLVATATERNVIRQLNWRPALDLYHHVVWEDSGQPFERGSFFEVAKAYPFGIQRAGAECVVRDPLSIDPRDGIVCAGEVPENAVLHLLKGRPRVLVEAAGRAAAEAAARAGDAPVGETLVFDCLSRAAFLGERFGDEVAAVERRLGRAGQPAREWTGVLSLGEIAASGEGVVEFLNKTIVVGLLHAAAPPAAGGPAS